MEKYISKKIYSTSSAKCPVLYLGTMHWLKGYIPACFHDYVEWSLIFDGYHDGVLKKWRRKTKKTIDNPNLKPFTLLHIKYLIALVNIYSECWDSWSPIFPYCIGPLHPCQRREQNTKRIKCFYTTNSFRYTKDIKCRYKYMSYPNTNKCVIQIQRRSNVFTPQIPSDTQQTPIKYK